MGALALLLGALSTSTASAAPASQAGPQGAAQLVLTKTVGTNPAVCATTTSVVLPPNGQVYYCFTMRNTGSITFITHTLTDNQVGLILTNFNYNLPPGASAFLMRAVVLTQPTVNTAAWTAVTSPGDGPITVTAVATAEVVAPRVLLSKTVGTDPALCATGKSVQLPPGGGQVVYCYNITNLTAVTLTRHTLVDDQLGTLLNSFTYTLTPGTSAFLTRTAVIEEPTVNTATWTAFNPGPTDVFSSTSTAEVYFSRLFLPWLARGE